MARVRTGARARSANGSGASARTRTVVSARGNWRVCAQAAISEGSARRGRHGQCESANGGTRWDRAGAPGVRTRVVKSKLCTYCHRIYCKPAVVGGTSVSLIIRVLILACVSCGHFEGECPRLDFFGGLFFWNMLKTVGWVCEH